MKGLKKKLKHFMRTELLLATKRMELGGVVVLFEGKLKYAPQTVGDTTQIP